jgi:hypothetical protein
MSEQSQKVAEVLSTLGDKAFGVLVSHRGHTMQLCWCPSDEEWCAYGDACPYDGENDEVGVEERDREPLAALEACADRIEAIEIGADDGEREVDEVAEDAWFEQRNTPR